MAVVEQMVPQGLLVWTPPTVNDPALCERLRVQNTYISTTVIRNLLNADGLNGIRWRHNPALFTHEAIVESGVRDVCTALENGCYRLRTVDAEEMDALIGNLDLSDANLYETYQTVARMLTDNITFGRIYTLFLFTYLLCKRLHQENRQSLIESVVEWQVEFLNDNVNPWLERNHGGQWVSGSMAAFVSFSK